jgi:hypothetical protein
LDRYGKKKKKTFHSDVIDNIVTSRSLIPPPPLPSPIRSVLLLLLLHIIPRLQKSGEIGQSRRERERERERERDKGVMFKRCKVSSIAETSYIGFWIQFQ